MTTSAVVRAAEPRDALAVAALHMTEIPNGFLATLGPRFLRRLYRRATSSHRAFVLVACEGDGRVVGFVAATHHTGAFYRDFIFRDALVAGLSALPSVLRHPVRVVETLRYGRVVERAADAEILSIAVSSSAQGAGIGAALLDAALDELRFSGIHAASVVTAPTNDAARRMYERAGFRRFGELEVHAGVAQEVLVWP